VITAWRIVKANQADTAFDGEGARLLGGRWNAPGSPLVYTAESAALAALEMLVHLGRSAILQAYVLIACTFDQALVTHVDRSRLPVNWRSYPAPPELQLIGTDWVRNGTSMVLEVPNAIIATGSNYLLNPQHVDFGSIRISEPQPFDFDLRLLRG
jgi:RES domain-containing protein